MRPEVWALFRAQDRRNAFLEAAEATQKSKQEPGTSFWACVEWRGHGKHRRPREWRGYLEGVWCATVRHARRGLFYATAIVAGTVIACAPFTTGRAAQVAALEAYLPPVEDVEAPVVEKPRLPYKPRRKPKTEAANQAAKVKATEVESFKSAFNQKFRRG